MVDILISKSELGFEMWDLGCSVMVEFVLVKRHSSNPPLRLILCCAIFKEVGLLVKSLDVQSVPLALD